MDLFLLLLGTVMSGVYAIGLKPAMERCRTNASVELFNGATTLVATLAALILCAMRGSVYLPSEGILTAAVFGVIFSATVFFNLVAIDYGPLSITNLVINFSLVVPLVYGFAFLGEPVTPLRMVGIGVFAVCMFLFCNPFDKSTSDGAAGGKRRGSTLIWILLTMASFATNGMLMLIQKDYALKTDNAYAMSFLLYSYLFATVTSVVLAVLLKLVRRRTASASASDTAAGISSIDEKNDTVHPVAHLDGGLCPHCGGVELRLELCGHPAGDPHGLGDRLSRHSRRRPGDRDTGVVVLLQGKAESAATARRGAGVCGDRTVESVKQNI